VFKRKPRINTDNAIVDHLIANKMMKEKTVKPASGTIMQIVRLKTELSEEELLKKAREREPQFYAIPGLIQKYYVKIGSEGEYGGVYIWDSIESLKAYRESELAATIPQAYEVSQVPSIEIAGILFQLRQ
jgi:heme-degrading monooxygenase HmoA